ncbi:MAG: hypothetical protein EA367_07570 [Leptolyngbya sp. DLM2.Bin15]|nr:MAG: hypothetical protein EA367_07570 [Leptolyngbya sp. DLM2.Bin15]
MSIEQTSQLLQLILNSLILGGICVVVLLVLALRQQRSWGQLQDISKVWNRSMSRDLHPGDRPPDLRDRVQDVRRRYRQERQSLLLVYYAFAANLGSTVLLALRAFIPWNGLIVASLGFFLCSLGLLLWTVLRLIAQALRTPSRQRSPRRLPQPSPQASPPTVIALRGWKRSPPLLSPDGPPQPERLR